MKYPANIITNSIQIPISRICNRQCPDCGARDTLTWYNKSIIEKEVSLEELKIVGDKIGKIERLEITGGEPTLHSKFEELASNLKYYFQCDNIWLITNGWLFKKDPSKLKLLLNFQNVYITHYTDIFAQKNGGTTNTNFLKNYPKIGFHPNTMNSHTRHLPPYGGNPCHLAYIGFNSYYEGKLYGCCTAWSQPNRGTGIPLTEDWRNHLTEIDLPCKDCFIYFLVAETPIPLG